MSVPPGPSFDPHTNDDVAVALLMLGRNHARERLTHVVPGSHRSRYSQLSRTDKFVARRAEAHQPISDRRARADIIGKGGARLPCREPGWCMAARPTNRTERTRRSDLRLRRRTRLLAVPPMCVAALRPQ